jgi:hypothetical protein
MEPGLGTPVGTLGDCGPLETVFDAHLAMKEALICRAAVRWRDPDSNRGHRDCQSCRSPTYDANPGPGLVWRDVAEYIAPVPKQVRCQLLESTQISPEAGLVRPTMGTGEGTTS